MKIILFLALFCFSCIFSSKRIHIDSEFLNLYIFNSSKNVDFCLVNVARNSETGKCFLNSKKESFCTEFYPEAEFSTSPKENKEILFKGLAYLELNENFDKANLKNVNYYSTDYFNSIQKSDLTKIHTEIEKGLKEDSYPSTVKILTPEEEIRFIAETFKEKHPNIPFINFSSESISVLSNYSGVDLTKVKPINYKYGIENFLKEFAKDKEEFRACRQPISSFFKTDTSSFLNCKENIKKLFPKLFKDIERTYIIDEALITSYDFEYYLPKESKMNLAKLNKIGEKYCKMTLNEILNLGIRKKEAYNLCYAISFHASILEALNITKIRIEKRESYFKEISASCN